MTKDDLYKAWHAVGADIAGLKFEDFLKHLPAKQQEPVAWTVAGKVSDWSKDFSAYQTRLYVRPVYTTLPQRQPLTDEELREALRQCPHDTVENLRVRWLYAKDFARAIEAAHGIGEIK